MIKFKYLVMVVIFTITNLAVAEVKMSSTNMCHDESSSYYSRIVNFKPYETLCACLLAGGQLPKGYISTETDGAYDRSEFGAWIDEDGDCLDTRHELLNDRSLVKATFNDNCVTVSGSWISIYTNLTHLDPSTLDIDHVVPLKFAWVHGADTWTYSKRVMFANDPLNLEIVEDSLNRSKGYKGILEWLPNVNVCTYMEHFLQITDKYNLHVPNEQDHYVLECT
jgi:hypothetical protein